MIESYNYGTDRDRCFSTSSLHPHPMVEYAHGKMGNLSAADGSDGVGGSAVGVAVAWVNPSRGRPQVCKVWWWDIERCR